MIDKKQAEAIANMFPINIVKKEERGQIYSFRYEYNTQQKSIDTYTYVPEKDDWYLSREEYDMTIAIACLRNHFPYKCGDYMIDESSTIYA